MQIYKFAFVSWCVISNIFASIDWLIDWSIENLKGDHVVVKMKRLAIFGFIQK